MGRAFECRRASKEKRWDKMSKLFPKLGKAITVAAKNGVPDPEANYPLRIAIANAKAENMPKDKIEAAIKRASGKDATEFQEIHYEGKGPHGVLVFIECATDNPTRTVANVKSYFNKSKPEPGQVLTNGSLEFMFNRKAVIEFPKPEGRDLEELELELIDAGLEELEVDGDDCIVYGDFTSFGSLSQAMEDIGIPVSKATLKRIPTSPVSFTEEQLEDIEKFLDKIEDDDDVQSVFTNIA